MPRNNQRSLALEFEVLNLFCWPSASDQSPSLGCGALNWYRLVLLTHVYSKKKKSVLVNLIPDQDWSAAQPAQGWGWCRTRGQHYCCALCLPHLVEICFVSSHLICMRFMWWDELVGHRPGVCNCGVSWISFRSSI